MTADARAGRTAEQAAYRPELADQVMISDELLHDASTVRVLKHRISGQTFRVGVKEYFLISRMDGTRTLEELAGEYAVQYGRRIGEANWRGLLQQLGSRGLLVGAPAPDRPVDDAGDEQPPNTVLRGSIPLVADADATVARLHRATRFLLARACWIPLCVLVIAMEAVAALRLDELLDGLWAVFRNPVLLAGIGVLLWLSTVLHELAHGVVARHFGGTVGEIGLRWRLPSVIMYCRVDNFMYLPTRAQRIATAVAGAVMNLVFLLPFCAVWLFVPVDEATADGLAGLLFLGSVQALAMLLPLPPLDGYKIANQLAGTTDLAGAGRRYLQRRRGPDAPAYRRRARYVYTAYAVCFVLVLCALAAALTGLVAHLVTHA